MNPVLYRAYLIDTDDDKIRTFRIIEAADDAAALLSARQLVDGFDVELWEGKRLVGRLPFEEQDR